MIAQHDRRAHTRVAIERPCKIFHQASRRYLAAKTTDFCAGGTLCRVTAPRPMSPGDTLDFYIAWDRRALVATSAQLRGTVVRAHFDGLEQVVAVKFDRPVETPLSSAA
jgi:c-di-GMP-binding flagellar brake protein YcgR